MLHPAPCSSTDSHEAAKTQSEFSTSRHLTTANQSHYCLDRRKLPHDPAPSRTATTGTLEQLVRDNNVLEIRRQQRLDDARAEGESTRAFAAGS